MRLFVAVELPAPVRERLAALAGGLHGAKWVGAEQMHLTLTFLGELDRIQAEDVAEQLGEIRAKAFDVELAGIGNFASARQVRSLWVGVAANDALTALQAKVEHAARRAGVKAERRKFVPHVSLARFKNGTPNVGKFLEAHEPFRVAPFAVSEFVLFSSRLGSDHAVYTAEVRYPLS